MIETYIETYTVYALQHNITGRIYVGLTKHLKERIYSHLYALRKNRHVNKGMQDDFNKYGEDFSIFKLEDVDCTQHVGYATNMPTAREKYWQCKLKTYDPAHGYNREDPKYRRLKALKTSEAIQQRRYKHG